MGIHQGTLFRDHKLDLVGAFAQLLAYRLQHLRHAVYDTGQVGEGGAAGTAFGGERLFFRGLSRGVDRLCACRKLGAMGAGT